MENKRKGKISDALQAISIIPLIFFGIAIMVFGSRWITEIMHEEVMQGLQNVAYTTNTMLNALYPGDYRLVETDNSGYLLYKGDSNITGDYSLVDRVKQDTGMDVSLFYQDTRILTTLYNAEQERIIGTAAPDQVLADVLTTGEAHFYENTIISGSTYFSYYMPLFNSDGTLAGMLFVGKSRSHVDHAIQSSVYPLVGLVGVTLTVIAVCIFMYTRKFVSVLLKLRAFLAEISTGNLNTEIDMEVVQRNDELGDIGRSALSMQRSLRNMVEQDTLTGLFNRRSADRRLKQIIERTSASQSCFSLAIGDIDFFKKVNDTYGHDAGDIVLKTVADALREHMLSKGFVARWGGEEFLLVFDRMSILEAYDSLEELLEKIRATECVLEEGSIRVTMTFGVTDNTCNDINTLLKLADEKLYNGKQSGRNRVIM